MSTDLLQQTAEAEAPADAPAPIAEAPAVEGHDEAPAVSPETESRARQMGWVPKEEFRGPPDLWRDADEFVRRGEEVLPIVRANLSKAERKVAELESKLQTVTTEFSDRVARLDRATAAGIKQRIDGIHAYYEQEKRKAVEVGDIEKYDALNRQHVEQVGAAREEAEEITRLPQRKAEPTLAPDIKQTVESWVGKHQQAGWWGNDREMTETAIAIHVALRNAKPDQPIPDNLEEVERRLAKLYPDKISTKETTREPAPTVESGSRRPGTAQPKGKGWADIPAEDRKQAEKFITRDGLFLPAKVKPEDATEKDLMAARAAYAKEYFSQ